MACKSFLAGILFDSQIWILKVVFSTSPLGDLTGKVSLTNTSGKPLGYKIKTTSPEKYRWSSLVLSLDYEPTRKVFASRVRPSTGSISPGQSVTVEIHVSGQKEVMLALDCSHWHWRVGRWQAWAGTNSWWPQSCSTGRTFPLRNSLMLSELKLRMANTGPLSWLLCSVKCLDTGLLTGYAAIWRAPLRRGLGLGKSTPVLHLQLLLRTRPDRSCVVGKVVQSRNVLNLTLFFVKVANVGKKVAQLVEGQQQLAGQVVLI